MIRKSSLRNNVAIRTAAEILSVNKITRIEFTTYKGCPPCVDAIRDLRPIAKKYKIPLIIKEAKLTGPGSEAVIPITCIIKKNERPVCIYGWDEDYKKDVEEHL